MQEENGRLQKENAQLIRDLESHPAAGGSSAGDERLGQLAKENSELRAEKEALRQELDRAMSDKSLLEQENEHLIEALAIERPTSPSAEPFGQPSSTRSRGDAAGEGPSPPPHAAHDRSLNESEERLSGDRPGAYEASAGRNREGGHKEERKRDNVTPNARLWSSSPVWVSKKSAQPVHGIAVGRDLHCGALGDVGVVSWDGSCTLLRAQASGAAPSFRPVWSVSPGKGLYSVAFGGVAPGNGTRAVLGVASMDGSCYVLDVADGATLFRFRGHQGEVNAVHFQPQAVGAASGETLAASGSDDTMCLVWAPAAARQDSIARLAGHSQAVYGVRFHPVHPSLLATVAFDRLGKIWDLRTGQAELDVVGHTDDIIGLDLSPDGRLLATGSDDCTCRVWDLRNVGPNGAAAAAVASGAGRNHLMCLQHEDEVKRLEWSACGSLLATASSNGHINVWQTGSPANRPYPELSLSRSLPGHDDTVFDVAWLPLASEGAAKGAYLMSASHDFTVKAWGTSEGGDGIFLGSA